MSSKNAPFFRTKKDIQCQWPQFRDIPQLSQNTLLPSQQQLPGWGQPPDIYILFRQFSGHHWKIFPDRLFSDNYFYILQSHGGMLGLPRPDFLQRIKQRILCECFSNIFSRQVTVRIRLVRDGSSFVSCHFSLRGQRSQTYQWLFPATSLGTAYHLKAQCTRPPGRDLRRVRPVWRDISPPHRWLHADDTNHKISDK